MIKNITLQFGPKGRGGSLPFEPGSVTIFVGPNNSGKSLLLREIKTFCEAGMQNNFKVLNNVEFDPLNDEIIKKNIELMRIPFKVNEPRQPGTIKYGRFNSTKGFMQFQVHPQQLLQWKLSPSAQTQRNFFSCYVSMYVSHFGGKDRFAPIQPPQRQQHGARQEDYNLKLPPKNNRACLFKDNGKRAEVRNLTYEAFGNYFVIDPTDIGKLEIRLSDKEPPSEDIEKGLTSESIAFHEAAKPITEFSDGVQAFTSLIMAVVAGEEKIILVDEPEAFLHPTLAKLLGKKLSTLMSKRDGHLVVATHSPFFTMGCLQSGKKLNIIRLTYDKSTTHSTARLLESDKIVDLFKDPLLRSTGVIEALFHSAVIVTEGDTDRAFYNEINERMLTQNDTEGINNGLFLNAQNKQTIGRIISPLRDIGIPAVGIFDIDLIKDGGQNFTNILKTFKVPSDMHRSLSSMRSDVLKAFKEVDNSTGMKDMKRKGGISLLSGGKKDLVEKFLKDLEEYGIFIVSGGEVESWLKSLSCTNHGPDWLIQVFTKMGTDPADSGYLKPDQGDVWEFLRSINKWIKNPNRKGMGHLNENNS